MGDLTDSIQQLSTTSTEFKRALKVLIKYEINCLLQRLSDTGEEAIIITTSVEDGVQGQLGTVKGEGFLQATNHVKALKEHFLQFCTDPALTVSDKPNSWSNTGPVDFSKTREPSAKNGLHLSRMKHNQEGIGDSGETIDSKTSQNEANRFKVTSGVCAPNIQNHVNEREIEESDKFIGSRSSLIETTGSKDLDQHCVMSREKLYPLEPRNTESTYFQESDLHGMVCKKEEVRKMFEQTDDSDEPIEGSGTFPMENRISVNDKREVNGEVRENEYPESSVEEKGQRRIRDYPVNSKSMQHRKSPYHRPNHSSTKHPHKDESIREHHVSTNDHISSDMHTSGYSDFETRKMLGFYPAINSIRENHIVSRRDLESLHQIYFGGVKDDFDGELIDFSLKKENQSKMSSDEESVNMMHTEEKTKNENPDSNYQLKYKDHSDSDGYFSGKKYRVNRFGEQKAVKDSFPDKNRNNTAIEGIHEHHRKGDVMEHFDCDHLDSTSELCEPVNLKIEPDDKTQFPVVKIEPGIENPSTIEKMLSDPNVPNYTLHGQGHSPTSTLTMHLNFSCKICGQNFKNRQYRDFHVRLHESAHHYYCNLCSAGFDNETDCKNHQSEHREPVFQCESCGYRCTREFRMRAHKEICGSPSKIFKCPFCYKQFAAQRYMRIHIKSHDAHNVHTCPVCHNTYPLKNSLLKHMKKKHYQN